MIAELAVAAAIYAIDKPYSYRIPDGMLLHPGMRVRLPFGNGNRRTEGVVLRIREGEEAGLKCIDAPLDDSPLLSERMLHLAAFLRERYFCTFYDAIRAILPAGLWYSQEQTIRLAEPFPEDWASQTRRKPDAQKLLLLSCEKLRLSNRAYTRILKVARTIADLEGVDVIESEHISEAVQYRTLDRKYWG